MERIAKSILANDGYRECGNTDVSTQIEAAQAQGYDVPAFPEGMTATLELITREIAEELLAADFVNRKLSAKHVGLLAEDMNDRRFYTTNQAIGINEEGLLIDGQHRLEAILQSGKPQWMWVIRGVNKDAALALDRNRSRSPGDNINMMGFSYGTDLGSAARLVGAAEMAWERGYKISTVKSQQFTQATLINDILVSQMLSSIASGDPESLSWDDLQEAGRDLIEAARKLYEVSMGGPGVPKAAGAAFYYLARTYYGIEEADAFIEEAGSGLGLTKNSATQAFRNKIARIRQEASGRTGISSIEYLAYLIVAFNKSVGGEEVQRLDLPRSGELPKIVKKK